MKSIFHSHATVNTRFNFTRALVDRAAGSLNGRKNTRGAVSAVSTEAGMPTINLANAWFGLSQRLTATRATVN